MKTKKENYETFFGIKANQVKREVMAIKRERLGGLLEI